MDKNIEKENVPDIPTEYISTIKEEYKWNESADNKMFVSETNINISGTEFMDCIRDAKIEQCEIPTLSIKTELLACEGDINSISNNLKRENEIGAVNVKFEYENELLFCEDCRAYYEDYCIKCGMLVHILDKITFNNADNMAHEEIPKHILEIGDIFGKLGVYALKVIPEGVKFGPFTGLSCSAGSWKVNRGKFVASEEKSKFLSWMQYVNAARNAFDQNLLPFQYEDKLYYRSIRQIQVGEELLAYFGEEYENVLDDDDKIDYIPTEEIECRDVFACIFCCLGFSSGVHLDQHKKICQNRNNEKFSLKELVQCQFCKIYLAEKEYMEYHMTYCQDRNERKCIAWPLDNQSSEVKGAKTRRRHIYKCPHCTYKTQYKGDLKIHANKHYAVKTNRCGICSKRFKTKESLTVHVEGVHFSLDREDFKDQTSSENPKAPQGKKTRHPIKRYKCSLCDFRTKHKYYMKVHTKTKHLEQFDFMCGTCEYRTNYKPTLERHIKNKHLKEYDYECGSCEFKTNRKDNLEKHIKTKHLKRFDYKCNVCDYETNKKTSLVIHIKSKHLDEFDYKCDICDYKTYDRRCFERHVKIIHLQEFSYKCEICEYKTHQKRDLDRHVKTKHLEEFDYRCDMCDYKTNAKRDSEHHVRIKHLKQFSHACDSCDYKTYDKRNLTRHRKRKHLNVFDFRCDVCEYKTNDKASLNDHVKTQHLKQFDYNCTVCNYRTNRKHLFKGHMKRRHFNP